MATFAEYVAGVADPEVRRALQHAWDVAAAAAPEAEEGVSYGIPALKLGKSPVFAVQAAAKHLTMVPFDPAVLDALGDRLDGFARTKGTLQFSAAHPVPDDVIREMVRLRLEEIAG